MSYYDETVFLDDASESMVVVRGPFDVRDGGMVREAFQVEYRPGCPPTFFESDGMVYEARRTSMTDSKTAFTPAHMEQLRNLGMGGYPCATYAAREIDQLNGYAYVLELTLMYGFSNKEDVRNLIEGLRRRFAPNVEFPDVPIVEVD